MTIARADEAPRLLPEVLAFSSSLQLDLAMFREDILGSLAHTAMLKATGIIPAPAASAVREGLCALWRKAAAGTMVWPDEEDVHMAVESSLARAIGEPAQLLHSARSRNDQVALDLRMFVRGRAAELLAALADFIDELSERASRERDILMPAYTHRQRAQPVSAAYWIANFAAGFLRDAETLRYVLHSCRTCPLGVGAISGTSLPIDRGAVARLLGFEGVTLNGMDTVGDRDFAIDFVFACSKFMVRASRLSTDVIDFTTSEFGFASLAGDISMGSSMMPQKKNPDVFELVRGKSGRAIGNLTGLLATSKGLPSGYNRDLQEETATLVEAARQFNDVLAMLRLGLPRLTLNGVRTRAALEDGFAQATDMAEALVARGIPFRRAYRMVGTLVRKCQEQGLTLAQATTALAASIDPALDATVLAVVGLPAAVDRKVSAGGTSWSSVDAALREIRTQTADLRQTAKRVPTLDALFSKLSLESL